MLFPLKISILKVKQTSIENKEINQLRNTVLLYHKILGIDLERQVQQTVGRNEILNTEFNQF